MAQELTDACVRALGASPDAVQVLLFDVPKSHWAGGGVLYADRDAPAAKAG